MIRGNSIKEGTSAIYLEAGSPAGGNISSAEGESFHARVVFVLLDDSDKNRFAKYGGSSAIGTIECERLEGTSLIKGNMIVAKPIHSNMRVYPLVNEIVRIQLAPSFRNQTYKDQYQHSFYYTEVVGVWDNIEHNILPNTDDFKQKTNADKINTYREVANGHTISSNASRVNPLTVSEFKENGSIRRTAPLPGDVIIEGRHGSSIRFSASNEKRTDSPWIGPDGKSIFIIRNGQHVSQSGDNWTPSFEDINKDGSSLYMLSGHTLQVDYASKNFESLQLNVNDLAKVVEPQKPSASPSQAVQAADVINFPSSSLEDRPIISSSIAMTGSIEFLPDREEDFNFRPLADNFTGFESLNDIVYTPRNLEEAGLTSKVRVSTKTFTVTNYQGSTNRFSQADIIKTLSFLKNNGFTDQASAALTGALLRESALKPTAQETSTSSDYNGKGGYGLVQWTGIRKRAMFDYAKKTGKNAHTFDFQINYLLYELKTSEPEAYKALLSSTSIDDAIGAALDYERPGIIGERIIYAKDLFNNLSNKVYGLK